MKIRNLSAAIILGLGTLSTPVLISQTAQAADTETQQALAEQVKARIANLDNLASQTYQRFFSYYPSIKSITVQTGDYRQTDSGMTASSTLTITRDPAYLQDGESGQLELTLKDNIAFGDELMAQDILARIDGELVPNDSLKNFLGVQGEDADKFAKALQYLAIQSDLRPDGDITQLIRIKPFEHNEDGDTFEFSGLNLTTHANESTLVDGVGEMHIELGRITGTSTVTADAEDLGEQPAGQEQAADITETFTIHPISADYVLKENGEMSLKTSPLKIENTNDNLLITIDGIQGKGSDVHFDDAIGTFTGEQEYVIDNIRIKDDTMPSPIVIDSIHYDADAEKDGDLYDFSGEIKIDVNGESIRNLTGMAGLEVEDISFKVSIDDISAETFKLINYQLPGAVEVQDQAHLEQSLQTLINDIAQNRSGMKVDITFDTDQGDAAFVANIKAKDGAVTDIKQWQAAEGNKQPTAMINLLQQSFDFELKLTVPESLIKATGMEGMMAMTTGYVIKDGSDYVMHIENTDNGIELNGNLMPLPQQ